MYCSFFTLVLTYVEEFIIRSSSCSLQGRSDGVCQFSAHVAAVQCFPALVCKYFSKVCISDQASGARMYVVYKVTWLSRFYVPEDCSSFVTL